MSFRFPGQIRPYQSQVFECNDVDARKKGQEKSTQHLTRGNKPHKSCTQIDFLFLVACKRR